MNTQISNKNGKVVLQVPTPTVAFTTKEAFKLMKLFKKHIKEADEYLRKQKQEMKQQEALKKASRVEHTRT